VSADELTPAGIPTAALEVLCQAEVRVLGRMPWASNSTFLVRLVELGAEEPVDPPGTEIDPMADDRAYAIYKPVRGERPLWDFEPGLHRREVAAFRLSEALGFGVVPPTVLRHDAPLGEGSLQWFVRADHRQHYFTIAEHHPELHDQLQQIAVLDVLANNTDRKSGHCLLAGDRVWAIDNGLCFAADFKLRTVIWEFAGEPLTPAQRAAVARIAERVPPGVADLLDRDEVDALRARADRLAADGVLPGDDTGHRYPWPLV
jgi:uncharacterized repeat protein (TIGR03843 family)